MGAPAVISNMESRKSLKLSKLEERVPSKECIFQRKHDEAVHYDAFETEGDEDPDMIRVEDICDGADWGALTTPLKQGLKHKGVSAAYKLDIRSL